MSKKLRKQVRKDLKESITEETVEERYERLKIGERTGMALSTYEKLDDAFQDINKGDLGESRMKVKDYIMKAFLGSDNDEN